MFETENVLGGRGLEVRGCGAGAGKIFKLLRARGGFKFCGCGAGADKKFQSAQGFSLHGTV